MSMSPFVWRSFKNAQHLNWSLENYSSVILSINENPIAEREWRKKQEKKKNPISLSLTKKEWTNYYLNSCVTAFIAVTKLMYVRICQPIQWPELSLALTHSLIFCVHTHTHTHFCLREWNKMNAFEFHLFGSCLRHRIFLCVFFFCTKYYIHLSSISQTITIRTYGAALLLNKWRNGAQRLQVSMEITERRCVGLWAVTIIWCG